MSVGTSATTKSMVDLLELLGVETRQATSAPRATQRGRAAALPLLIPATDALTTDVEDAGDCCLDIAAREQPCRPLATLLECFEITARTQWWCHAGIIHARPGIVTLLCEVQ